MTSSVEERLSRLEGSYEQISERLNDLNQIVQGVDRKVDALRSDVDGRFDSLRSDMDTRFDSLRSSMDARFDSLRSSMDARFLAMDSKLDEMNRSYRNFTYAIYAIAAGMWATILVVGVRVFQNGGV